MEGFNSLKLLSYGKIKKKAKEWTCSNNREFLKSLCITNVKTAGIAPCQLREKREHRKRWWTPFPLPQSLLHHAAFVLTTQTPLWERLLLKLIKALCWSFSFLKWITKDRFLMAQGVAQWRVLLQIQDPDLKTWKRQEELSLSWIFWCGNCSRVSSDPNVSYCRSNTLLQSQLNHLGFIRITWNKFISQCNFILTLNLTGFLTQ